MTSGKPQSKLSPGFLVAAPSMTCPFFNHTVVLLVDHGAEGSFGFVINRPAEFGLPEILSELGIASSHDDTPEAPVLVGGPVSPEAGWIVYDPSDGDQPVSSTITISDHVSVTASIEMLHVLAEGRGPSRRMMMLGYSGWAPGQLDTEIREGAWIPVDLTPDIVFETPHESRWSAALALLGIDPARVVGRTVADA